MRLQSRVGRPVTQEEMAEYIGVSRAWYAMLETQARVRASAPLLDRLARALMLNSQERTLLFNLALPELRLDSQPPQTDLIEAQHSNLPPQLTSLIGRESVVDEIKKLVDAQRLVSLVGAGGIGKSRCAMKAGEELLDEFADGIWLVELGPLENPSLVAAAFTQALGVQSSASRPALDSLAAYLRRKHLLLIVDNCEHLIEAAGGVAVELFATTMRSYRLRWPLLSRRIRRSIGERQFAQTGAHRIKSWLDAATISPETVSSPTKTCQRAVSSWQSGGVRSGRGVHPGTSALRRGF